jgi:hypothetical protein
MYMIVVNKEPLEERIQTAWLDLAEIDADTLLLLDVDFKWLMAGHGWWIDSKRIHEDPAYAAQCLDDAMTSASIALLNCAAKLRSCLCRDSPVKVAALLIDRDMLRAELGNACERPHWQLPQLSHLQKTVTA